MAKKPSGRKKQVTKRVITSTTLKSVKDRNASVSQAQKKMDKYAKKNGTSGVEAAKKKQSAWAARANAADTKAYNDKRKASKMPKLTSPRRKKK